MLNCLVSESIQSMQERSDTSTVQIKITNCKEQNLTSRYLPACAIRLRAANYKPAIWGVNLYSESLITCVICTSLTLSIQRAVLRGRRTLSSRLRPSTAFFLPSEFLRFTARKTSVIGKASCGGRRTIATKTGGSTDIFYTWRHHRNNTKNDYAKSRTILYLEPWRLPVPGIPSVIGCIQSSRVPHKSDILVQLNSTPSSNIISKTFWITCFWPKTGIQFDCSTPLNFILLRETAI